MTAVYPDTAIPFFASSRAEFNRLCNKLGSEEMASLEADVLVDVVQNEGAELLRLIVQDYLDIRAALERQEPQSPIGADGVERGHRSGSHRSLETAVGRVRVKRQRCSSKTARGSLYPLDAALNLPPGLFSYDLQRVGCDFAADGSFDRACEKLLTYTGGKVSKRQLEELVQEATEDFDAFYKARQERDLKRGVSEPPDDDVLLILSTDGKGIVMRNESLRPSTRKKAESSEHRMKRRLSAGEKGNRKRMAEVATVYDIDRQVRRPEDIIASPDDELARRRSPRPKLRNKRVWASVDKSLKEVVEQTFDEAESRDPEHRRTWVYLVDGNRDQIRYARRFARQRGVKLTIIIDFIHVLEYLWKAAWSFFDKGDPKAEDWVSSRALRLLRGEAGRLAGDISRSATMRKLDEKQRKGADACVKYLKNKKELMHYDQYLAAGTPIATGVIEGACRHLVNDRLGITGARWGLAGAEAVLKLRALRSSGDFDAYWDFHRQQEWERNHRPKYADDQVHRHRSAA